MTRSDYSQDDFNGLFEGLGLHTERPFIRQDSPDLSYDIEVSVLHNIDHFLNSTYYIQNITNLKDIAPGWEHDDIEVGSPTYICIYALTLLLLEGDCCHVPKATPRNCIVDNPRSLLRTLPDDSQYMRFSRLTDASKRLLAICDTLRVLF